MNKQGFTLIELLLVMVLLSMLVAVAVPVSLRFFKMQIVSDTSTELVDLLRTAQMFALTQRHNSAYGVKMVENTFVLFEGESYAARVTAEDVSFPFPNTATVSGIDEIVFNQGTGLTAFNGVITVTTLDHVDTVQINPVGSIE